MADVFNLGFRAGFWRRALAFFIDTLVIGVPFQILAASLYVPSGGAIQTTSMIVECHYVPQPTEVLDPPPPEQSNFARECQSSFFGFVTSRTLIVGRVLREGWLTKGVSRSYGLLEGGRPYAVINLDWLIQLVFIAYLITLEHRTGCTLGKYLLRVTVVSWKSPGQVGIPLLNAAIRQLGKWLIFISVLVVLIYKYSTDGFDRFIMSNGNVLQVTFAYSLMFLWCLANFILIIVKRDPIYDRIGRVSVICE